MRNEKSMKHELLYNLAKLCEDQVESATTTSEEVSEVFSVSSTENDVTYKADIILKVTREEKSDE